MILRADECIQNLKIGRDSSLGYHREQQLCGFVHIVGVEGQY